MMETMTVSQIVEHERFGCIDVISHRMDLPNGGFIF